MVQEIWKGVQQPMRVYFYDIMKDETVIKLKKIKSKDFPGLKYDRLNSPGIVKDFMDIVYDAKNLVEERLWLICLNARLVPNAIFEVSHGTMNNTCCSPASIFQRVLLTGASDFIIVHNHPGGNVYPSQTDNDAFYDIRKLSKIMNLDFLDSIIIGNDENVYSYRNEHDGWND